MGTSWSWPEGSAGLVREEGAVPWTGAGKKPVAGRAVGVAGRVRRWGAGRPEVRLSIWGDTLNAGGGWWGSGRWSRRWGRAGRRDVGASDDAPGGGKPTGWRVDPTGVPAGIQRTKAERSSVPRIAGGPARGWWGSGPDNLGRFRRRGWRPNLRFEPTGLPSVGLRLKRESLGAVCAQSRLRRQK